MVRAEQYLETVNNQGVDNRIWCIYSVVTPSHALPEPPARAKCVMRV